MPPFWPPRLESPDWTLVALIWLLNASHGRFVRWSTIARRLDPPALPRRGSVQTEDLGDGTLLVTDPRFAPRDL